MRFDQVKFGHRIKHLRKKRNLTQEQLATALHISTDHLSKIELGKRGISIDLLFDISACILRHTAAVGAVVQRPLCGLSSGRN